MKEFTGIRYSGRPFCRLAAVSVLVLVSVFAAVLAAVFVIVLVLVLVAVLVSVLVIHSVDPPVFYLTAEPLW